MSLLVVQLSPPTDWRLRIRPSGGRFKEKSRLGSIISTQHVNDVIFIAFDSFESTQWYVWALGTAKLIHVYYEQNVWKNGNADHLIIQNIEKSVKNTRKQSEQHIRENPCTFTFKADVAWHCRLFHRGGHDFGVEQNQRFHKILDYFFQNESASFMDI